MSQTNDTVQSIIVILMNHLVSFIVECQKGVHYQWACLTCFLYKKLHQVSLQNQLPLNKQQPYSICCQEDLHLHLSPHMIMLHYFIFMFSQSIDQPTNSWLVLSKRTLCYQPKEHYVIGLQILLCQIQIVFDESIHHRYQNFSQLLTTGLYTVLAHHSGPTL